MDIEDEIYCRDLLRNELAKRKSNNSYYSLRAFARDLELGSTSLSDLLAGKRSLSKRNIDRVVEKLHLTPIQKDEMLSSGKEERKKSKGEIERLQLEEDVFRLISDWYYLAILNLAKIKNQLSKVDLIARRLGISEIEVESALITLQRLKLLRIKRGKLERTSLPLTTSRDIPSSAIRKHHKENLKLAEISLENDSLERREFTSITCTADPVQMKKAKDYLMRAKRRVVKILEGGVPSEVYTLSFQLFPLTKKVSKK